MDAHKEWRTKTFDSVRHNDMGEAVTTEYGRAVILDPEGDRDESHTVVFALPHQQGWKESMAIRAGFARDAVYPNSRMVILPNNTVGDKYYSLAADERQQIANGNLAPYFEQRVRLLESLEVEGSVVLSGYSLGALTAVGIAAYGSDRWDVRLVNADEAPNGRRTPKQMQSDFMKSGGWGEQQAAIADAGIPALSEAMSTVRLAKDYARFFRATLDPENAALAKGMSNGRFNEYAARAFNAHPDMTLKVGHVVGSRVFQPEAFDPLDARGWVPIADIVQVAYTGEYARLHPTGDNVAAHALMIEQAAQLAESHRG